MNFDIACQALNSGKRLQLRYDGFSRIVEVHIVGWTNEGSAAMRAWQTSGGSQSGEIRGWKLLRFDKVLTASITDEDSEAPRPEYKRNDPAITRVKGRV